MSKDQQTLVRGACNHHTNQALLFWEDQNPPKFVLVFAHRQAKSTLLVAYDSTLDPPWMSTLGSLDFLQIIGNSLIFD